MKIAILNQKGGVGKTTLSVNIACELARRKLDVLLIDADPQASALDWNSIREEVSPITVIGYPKPTLHKEIDKISKGYGYVIIDGAPRVTDLARSIILSSDIILIPIQPSPYDIWASEEIVTLIKEASVYNEKLKSFFVINRKISNTAIGRDIKEVLVNFEVPVLTHTISQRVSFVESATKGLAVYEIDNNSPATHEIERLVDELLEINHHD